MRLKEDPDGWHSSAIRRRDFRHTHGDPEVPKGHPKRKAKKEKKKIDHKHEWIDVTYHEYWSLGNGYRTMFWDDEPEWARYTEYFLCIHCWKRRVVQNVGKRRAYYKKKYGRSW